MGLYMGNRRVTPIIRIPAPINNQDISVTENGVYTADSEYTGLGEVIVNVVLMGINREVSNNGVYQMPSSNFSFSLPSNATDIGNYVLYNAFYYCTNLTSVDLSSLTAISGSGALSNAFWYCTGLTSIDLSSLTAITGDQALMNSCSRCSSLTSIDLSSLTTVNGNYAMGHAFEYCTSLTSIDLSSITTLRGSHVMGSAFNSCTNLSSVDFSGLTIIGNSTAPVSGDGSQFDSAFNYCPQLTSLSFPELTAIYCSDSRYSGTFRYNTGIQKFYFPKLTTITYGSGASSYDQEGCNYIFSDCSSLTEIHFGAANQSAIEATTGYSTLWGRGAGNATVYFDL